MHILTENCLNDPSLAAEAQKYQHALHTLNLLLGRSFSDPEFSQKLSKITSKLGLCNFVELTPEEIALIKFYCPTT